MLALVYLGMNERWLGDLTSAAARQDEAIALAESRNDDWGLAWALLWRAVTGVDEGDEAGAVELLESSRRHAERTGDPCLLGWIVKDLAGAALRASKVDDAVGLIEESIDILEPTGWHQGLAAALTEVGRALVAKDRVDEAVVHQRRALRIATDLGQPNAIAEALEALAEVSAASGDDRHAAELVGSAVFVRARMSAPKRSLPSGRALETLAARLRDSLGERDYSLAFGRGQRVAPTEVMARYDAAGAPFQTSDSALQGTRSTLLGEAPRCTRTHEDQNTKKGRMEHSLTGWDIVNAADVDWAPWGSGGDAKAKLMASAGGYNVVLVVAEPGFGTDPHVHAFPEFVFVIDGTVRVQGDVLGPGGAYAAAAESVHTELGTDSGATYLSIFKL